MLVRFFTFKIVFAGVHVTTIPIAVVFDIAVFIVICHVTHFAHILMVALLSRRYLYQDR